MAIHNPVVSGEGKDHARQMLEQMNNEEAWQKLYNIGETAKCWGLPSGSKAFTDGLNALGASSKSPWPTASISSDDYAQWRRPNTRLMYGLHCLGSRKEDCRLQEKQGLSWILCVSTLLEARRSLKLNTYCISIAFWEMYYIHLCNCTSKVPTPIPFVFEIPSLFACCFSTPKTLIGLLNLPC